MSSAWFGRFLILQLNSVGNVIVINLLSVCIKPIITKHKQNKHMQNKHVHVSICMCPNARILWAYGISSC